MEQSKKREELHRRIGAASKNRRGHRRYDSKLKRDIIRYVEQRKAGGASLKTAAREVSLSPDTVWTWLHGGKKQPRQRSRTRSQKTVRAVRVVSGRPEGGIAPVRGASLGDAGIVVVMPNGVRIEGLGAGEVAAIVRGLL